MSHSSSKGLQQQVLATLGEYLRRNPEALHPEDSLRDDLGLDSLQTIELVYQVESAFDIQIPDEDFGRLQTIGDVVTYLGERTGISNSHASPNNIAIKPKKHTSEATTKPKSPSRSKTSHK